MSSEGRKNCTEACVPLTPMLGLMAWLASLAGNYTCKFITIDVTINNLAYSLGFSLFNYQGWAYLIDSGTIYYTQTCFAYADDVPVDAKWATAQAFAIITAVVGGMATFGHWCIVCSEAPTKRYQIFALLYLFSCLSQGLTFLFLRGNACVNNPIFSTEVPEGVEANAGCNLAWGGNLSIASTVLWFCSACLVCYTGGTRLEEHDEVEDEGDVTDENKAASSKQDEQQDNALPAGDAQEPKEEAVVEEPKD